MGYGRTDGPVGRSPGRRAPARALAIGALQCVAILLVAFAFLRFAPGNPVDALTATSGAADTAARTHLEHRHGLHLPMGQQFIAHLARLMRGDLGTSIYFDTPVATLLAQRLPLTVGLGSSAIALALVLGSAGGILSAARPGSHAGRLVMASSVALQAVPSFVLATVLLVLVGKSGLLPVFGLHSFSGAGTSLTDPLLHLITPAVALTLTLVAPYALIARTAMADVLPQDYIRLARAKGLAENRVLLRHALPNAAIPILLIGGHQVATLIGGAVVVETIFGLPGVGRLTIEAALRRDYPVVSAVILLSGITVVSVYTLCDLLVALIDPRTASNARPA